MPPMEKSRDRSATWLPFVGAILFAIAHTQPPLYYSNQNQYFLHGLAAAGVGDLRSDWLANTVDPTPAFSFGVAWEYKALGEWPFHAAFFGLLVVYFLGLWGIATALPFVPRTRVGRAALVAILIVAHAGIVRAASVALLGVDYPWYLQAGVANQYLLGAGLQPSVFGVFLLLSLAAFAHDRPAVAGVLAAAACAIHSTYLLPAALLIGGMVVTLLAMGRRRAAAACGGSALAAVAPVVAFVLTAFAPTDPLSFAEAQRILAWERIPHHTNVSRWLDGVAGFQLAWIALGLGLLRRTGLFVPLAVAATCALVLSLVQVVTGDATLALLFPWRVSAVLVPVATVTVAAGLARQADRWQPQVVLAVSILASLVAVLGCLMVYRWDLGYQGSAAEDRLLEFVAKTHRAGDLYLLPTTFPGPPSGWGSTSSSFVPVSQTGRPAIFELQRFRLATGAAAFVDFKSVPYRDDEVREWHRRVTSCERWYETQDWDDGVIGEVERVGITHVVVPAGIVIRSQRLMLLHDDPAYRVYRLLR